MTTSPPRDDLRTWTWDELEAEVVRLEEELAARGPRSGEVARGVVEALFEVLDHELGGARVDAMLREAELMPSELRRSVHDWLPWSDYEALFGAVAPAVSEATARRLGASALRSRWLRFFLQGARALPLEASLRWSTRVAFGPGSVAFRGVESSVCRVEGRFIEVRYAPPPGGSFPPMWQAMTHGALGRFVELAGGRPDRMAARRDGATLVFRLEETRTATGPLRALVAAGLASWGGSLEHARTELDIRNRQLRRRIAELEAADRAEVRLEARLAARREQEAVGRLAAGVAHDLNNLLGAMTMQLDLLRASLDDDAEALAELAPMTEAVQLGAHRARDLMRLGRDLSAPRLAVDELDQRGLRLGGSAVGETREALVTQIEALRARLGSSEPPLSPPPPAAQASVAWRNVTDTLIAAERLGLSREELLAELSWHDPRRSPDSWMSWPQYLELLDRIEALAGEGSLRALGRQALESPLFTAVGTIAGVFFEEADLFGWLASHVFGPESAYFTGLPAHLEVHGVEELEVVWTSEGAAISTALGETFAGIVEQLPRLVGRPPAKVSVNVDPRTIRVRARLAHRDSLVHRATRLVARAGGAQEAEALREVYRELLVQNQRLEEKIVALEAARRRRRGLEQRLEQVRPMVATSQVAATVAHDFNNALTVVTGHTELLRLHLRDEAHRAELALLEDVSQRIQELTKKLRVIGRGASGSPQALDVATCLEGLTPTLRRAVEGQCCLSSRLPSSAAGARIDAESLERVVLNLVLNARDAAATAVELRLEEAHLDEGFVETHPGARVGPHLLLEVRDDGQGMAPDVVARAFEPYFTTKAEGSGVGLATVFGLVHQVGGTIWLASKPGEGTTVRVYLPAVTLERAPSAAAASPSAAPRPRREAELLVIDDDDMIRRVLARLLDGLGFALHTASSGDDALRQVRAGLRPTLVVSDVVMPGLRGRALADALRETLGPVPILFISGFSDQPLTLGPQEAFLPKPFRAEDLLASVDALLAEA